MRANSNHSTLPVLAFGAAVILSLVSCAVTPSPSDAPGYSAQEPRFDWFTMEQQVAELTEELARHGVRSSDPDSCRPTIAPFLAAMDQDGAAPPDNASSWTTNRSAEIARSRFINMLRDNANSLARQDRSIPELRIEIDHASAERALETSNLERTSVRSGEAYANLLRGEDNEYPSIVLLGHLQMHGNSTPWGIEIEVRCSPSSPLNGYRTVAAVDSDAEIASQTAIHTPARDPWGAAASKR